MQIPEKQDAFPWGDGPWLKRRAETALQSAPVNIYEVHLGSWRRTADGGRLAMGELTRLLVPYVKQMGFTHVHLLPAALHAPEDERGYRCTDPWQLDRRCGTPEEFMALVDALHRAGVGVFLDWVCPPLPPEEAAACALRWLDGFHLDGLRPVFAPDCSRPPALEPLHEAIRSRRSDVCVIGFGQQTASFSWVCPFAPLDPSRPAILALSHDEVDRTSLLGRMGGEGAEPFAAVRALYARMLALPAKALTMMGCEFGQREAWHCGQSLDWHLTERPEGTLHRQLMDFFRAAGDCYLRTSALWQLDGAPEGFCPLYDDGGVSAFLRTDRRGRAVLAVFNLTDAPRGGFALGVPRRGRYTALLRTDAPEFGGEGRLPAQLTATPVPLHGMGQFLSFDLPPMSAVLLNCPRKNQNEKVFP